MLNLDPEKLAAKSIPVRTGWFLGACMEACGKQDLWMRQKPEVLEVLHEQAVIQSAESSNRIEGVRIPAERLRPVVLGKACPRNRSEQELAGYRRALDGIFSRKRPVPMTPRVVQRLYALAQGGRLDPGGARCYDSNRTKRIRMPPEGVAAGRGDP